MGWDDVVGHEQIRDRFQRAAGRGRLGSTFLFVGPSGVGKRKFADQLAQALLCETAAPTALDACGSCPSCQLAAANTHPDLVVVTRPEERMSIPIELLIGDREHRMRAGLCHQISLSPFHGRAKVAIIDDADYLNEEGANCLLKTLEEPPPHSTLILIATSASRQLPTILSRSQVIAFGRLTREQVAECLRRSNEIDSADADALAAAAEGSVGRALEQADPDLREFQGKLLEELAAPGWNAVEVAKRTYKFVEAAGTDAYLRRTRVRRLIVAVSDFYRSVLQRLAGRSVSRSGALAQAAEQAAQSWPGNMESLGACLDACLDAELHLAGSANLATLMEWWFHELYRGSRAPA